MYASLKAKDCSTLIQSLYPLRFGNQVPISHIPYQCAKDKDFSGWIQVKSLALTASWENCKEIFDLKSKGGNCHQHTLAKPTFLILHWPMYEVPLLVSNQIWLHNFLQMLIVLRSTLTASMTSNSSKRAFHPYLSYIKLVPWEALLIACWQACC